MNKQQVIEKFGFDPESIGNRYRDWEIVEELDMEDVYANAEIGDLCVRARDGASNTPDQEAFRRPNYRGTVEDGFDQTYRYYYFSPLEKGKEA